MSSEVRSGSDHRPPMRRRGDPKYTLTAPRLSDRLAPVGIGRGFEPSRAIRPLGLNLVRGGLLPCVHTRCCSHLRPVAPFPVPCHAVDSIRRLVRSKPRYG